MLGDPRRAIRTMAVPFLVALLVVQVNVFADTFWVSGLGVNAVSGMTTAVPLYVIFGSLGIGLSVGVTSTIAFRLGRGDTEGANRLAGNAIFIALALSVIGSLVIFLILDPMVTLMGADDVREEVRAYVLPYILFSPVVVISSTLGGLLRSEGAAKRSTAVQITAAVVNIILDPLLIYVLGMGLQGAALATILSALVSITITLSWYVRGSTAVSLRLRNLRPEPETCRDLMTVGGPRTVEGLINNTVVLLQRIFIIAASGTVGVSLFNVPFRYVNLCMCPCESTGMAMVPVAAAAYGREDMRKMMDAMMYALKLSMLISFGMTALMLILSEPMVALFTGEESMYAYRSEFLWNLRMYSVILPFFSVQAICSSMLQAVKRSMKPMQLTLVMGTVKLFMFWIASYYDYRAITVALILSYVFSAVFMALLARREISRLPGMRPAGASQTV